MPSRIAEFLISWRWPLLGLAALLTAVSWRPASRLDFDRSVENMFAANDPLLPPYLLLKRAFRGNEVVLAAYVDEQLMTPAGYRRLERLTRSLSQVAGVAMIAGRPSDAARPDLAEFSPAAEQPAVMSLTSTPLGIGILDASLPGRDALLAQLEGYLVDAARRVPAVVCLLDPRRSSSEREATVLELRRLVKEHDPTGVLVGEPVMVVEGFRLIDQDGQRLGQVASVLLMLTIILCFRSVRWVVIPLAVVYATLLWTKGLLVSSRIPLSMVSSMLWAIVTVVGIATVIHIIVRFREARSEGDSPRAALQTALTALAFAIFWTCLTDAAGFSSLLAANVGPVQDFGLMMMLGALLSLLAIALIVPGLALAGTFDIDPQQAWGERWVHQALRRLMDGVLRRPWSFLLAITAAGALATSGVIWLEVETDFTKNFRAGSDIVRSYTFVEDNLGGAGVWDVIVPAPAEIDEAYLDALRKLSQRLRDELGATLPANTSTGDYDPHALETRTGLTKVLSLADMLDAARQMSLQIDPRKLMEAPIDPLQLSYVAGAWLAGGRQNVLAHMPPQRLLNLLSTLMPAAVGTAVGEDPAWAARGVLAGGSAAVAYPRRYYTRILLRAYERQPAQAKAQLIAAVQRICHEEFASNAAFGREAATILPHVSAAESFGVTSPVEVTGFFVLLAHLIESMIRDQWVTFSIAIAAIGGMMLLAFRSFVLALVALVPNILPIVMISGLMGWLQFPINMGAAMIAAVSLGLAVDSSIHYILAFKNLRRAGLSVNDALHRVQQSVGRAVTFSTLALIVGFSALCFSDFIPTVYFGVLVALAMLGGMFGNLALLPVLLKLTAREASQK